MMIPTQAQIHLKEKYHQAHLAFQQGQWDKAAQLLDELWLHLPHVQEIGFKLGITQMSLKRWDVAITTFERLFAEGLNDPALCCNLGISYWKNGQLRQALIYFRYNLKHHPYHAETHLNLANLYLSHQHFKPAIQHYQNLVNQYPSQIEYRFNLAASLQKYGIFDEAIVHYRHILTQTPIHLDTFYNLACIYWQLQDYPTARHFCIETLKYRHHQELVFMRKKIDNEATTSDDYQAYVHGLFENYASHYNYHMQKALNYAVPNLLNLRLKHLNQRFERTLDLGCGTGLAAKMLGRVSKQLYGVDCAKAMLQEAEKTKLYHQLIQMDALAFLKTSEQTFDLIVALELMPYIQEPSLFFQEIAKRLSPGGHFIFTYEIGEDCLQKNARMGFSENLIHQCIESCGLKVKSQEAIKARLHESTWLDMMFVDLKNQVPTED